MSLFHKTPTPARLDKRKLSWMEKHEPELTLALFVGGIVAYLLIGGWVQMLDYEELREIQYNDYRIDSEDNKLAEHLKREDAA